MAAWIDRIACDAIANAEAEKDRGSDLISSALSAEYLSNTTSWSWQDACNTLGILVACGRYGVDALLYLSVRFGT